LEREICEKETIETHDTLDQFREPDGGSDDDFDDDNEDDPDEDTDEEE
jgi:hypothetical protein